MFGSICVVLLGLGACLGLNAVYVNNHKIDKYDVDKIKLLSPTPSSDHVTKINLITKDNFTNPLHYYQYLVGNDPGGHVELLWGNNKTYLPTIFRSTTTTEPSINNTINYADDLSSMENTLNNTTPVYKGDYHEEPIQIPPTTTARPMRRLKKPTKKPPPIKNQTQISEKTLELLRKYFTINCTLTPLQEPSTTPMPKIAASTKKPKAKIKRRKNTKTTAASTLSSTTATTTTRPSTKKSTKHKKPYEQVVYVDPPVISSISGVLESMYNYMEDAFVSTEYISIEDEGIEGHNKQLTLQKKTTKNGKKIKRNSVGEGSPEMTTAAVGFTSKQYQEETPKRVTLAEVPLTSPVQANKNKLTTNIHVTSEYTPATPATVPFLPQALIDDKDGSSEEESEEGDYYEGFSNTSYEEDEEDDEDDEGSQEDEENSDEYDESVEAAGNQAGGVVNDKDYDYDDDSAGSSDKIKVKITKQPEGGEDYSDEDSEEYDSGEDSGGGPGSFFSGLFSSIGRFVRSLGFGPRTTVMYDDYDETRSTTPRIVDLKKRPTRSTSNEDTQTQIERVHDATEKQHPWYHYPAYLYNEIEEPEVQLPVVDHNSVTEPYTDPDWFNFMTPWDFFNPWIPWDNPSTTGSSPEPIEITSAPTVSTTTESSAGWLPNLFGGEPPTHTEPVQQTTRKPLIPFLPASDPLQKPENWLGVIAQHVFTTTRKPKTTTQVPSTTHLTKPTKVHYSGYELWRVFPRTAEHIRSLEDYRLSPEGVKLQWWKGPSLRGANDILVPPHMVETLGEYLQDEVISKEVVIRNLGQAILYENPKMTRREQIEIEVLHGHPLTWYRYHRYADLTKFMNYLGRRFPKNVELIHIGRSFEGRPLTVVKVKFDGKRSLGGKMSSNSKYIKGDKVRQKKKKVVKRKGQRPAVFIEAGAHGREWIGPSVATWMLDTLTKAISSNDTELENVKSMDWYVLPVLNPDGYEYSHEYDRMWRKSRSKHQETQSSGILSTALNWLQQQSSLSVDSDQSCIGTDLNRNWDHRWNLEGASKSACSEYYSGNRAFSELETRALSKFLLQARRNIQIYLSLHSYGQTISYPDQKRSEGADRFGDVHEMAAVAVETLRGSGSHVTYQVDSEGEMSYPSSGTSVEFARYEAGIKYSYSVDLPDTGTHGFLFPPSGIENTARDTFELIKGMVDYI
ncbi:uncharacterized protein LOC109432959 [Aedes albopictus]|uniref:Peptidase M14 domain-containing protein n=1 Tax=Aedes albopictus TaxID=7160 RepID=A0ABM1YEH1_AEDAL|nr:uncharacterized protein LOC115269562 [Aedes albopictus]KXJ72626.1 hypothetical protein RP20_CCG017549 [Aedes albopictus]